MARRVVHWLIVLALLVAAPTVSLQRTLAQDPLILGTILSRAADYVVGFRLALSGIVAEEHYRQLVRSPTTASGRLGAFRRDRRELRSDFLLVRPEGEDHYFEFRDVFEVDGRPVRDREERLSRLFLDRSGASSRQIQEITNESARYNIGSVERTLNTPTLALLLLDPRYQPTVTFSLTNETTPVLDLDLGDILDSPNVLTVEFIEQGRDTLVRGQRNIRLPAVGRFWIEASTGVVVASELVVDASDVNAIVDVRFGLEPNIGLHVPLEMRERYEGVRDGVRIDGTATYAKFRQFLVQVDETQDVDPKDD